MTTKIITIYFSATVHDATKLMRIDHTNFIVVNRQKNSDELVLVVMSHIARKVLVKNPSLNESIYVQPCQNP